MKKQVKSFKAFLREDFQPQTHREELSLMSTKPLKARKQQVLSPAQQLQMRREIMKCRSLRTVIKVVDKHIFDQDHDGEVDEIIPAVDRNFPPDTQNVETL
ncbi:hypothetical protein N9L79_07405 [Alphaproteobacteria bacterium]|nr:hypothetical protein [Alphaproteobacteria bacterium]